MKHLLFLIPALLALTACDETIKIKSSPVDVQIVQPENPAPVNMLPIQWMVVTKDNLKDFTDKMAASQGSNNIVFIAIDAKTYENIRLNFDDLRRYIEQQQAIIVYYKNITTSQSK